MSIVIMGIFKIMVLTYESILICRHIDLVYWHEGIPYIDKYSFNDYIYTYYTLREGGVCTTHLHSNVSIEIITLHDCVCVRHFYST